MQLAAVGQTRCLRPLEDIRRLSRPFLVLNQLRFKRMVRPLRTAEEVERARAAIVNKIGFKGRQNLELNPGILETARKTILGPFLERDEKNRPYLRDILARFEEMRKGKHA